MERLAAEEYLQLQMLTGGAKLDARQLEQAVREYGRTIVPLPKDALPRIDYVAIANSEPQACKVRWIPTFAGMTTTKSGAIIGPDPSLRSG